MSYEVHLYHSDVYAMVEEGWELDEIPQPDLEDDDLELLLDRLGELGYELESEQDDCLVYSKDAEGCPVTAKVSDSAVTFSVPEWEECNDVIDDAIEDAVALAETDSLVVYDPQTDAWL